MREFDNLVRFADARTEAGQKVGSDLRPEAVQYLGVSFAEPDWDGDTLPDPITGLQRALEFYKGREGQKHVREVFQRLGDIYFDQTKYADAIAVYKTLLSKWPYYVDAPKVQDRIVHAYEKDRNLVAAAKEREALGRNYTKGSDWYQHNRENPDALAAAQELAEDALLTAATNVHAGAQACKTKWQENQKDTAKLEECKKLYATAADLYEKYLAAYPNSKRVYEFSAFYADALYYSGQLPQAIAAYKVVRDSVLDNRYQEDAAFRMIKGYEEIIGDMKAQKKIEDPPIPDEKNTKPPVAALPMPEIYKKYLDAIDWYVANVKNDRVPDLKYAAAVIVLRYRDWPAARERLSAITEKYCGTKADVGFKAYDAILQTYFIDYNVEDEEQKDCALGKLLTVVDQFSESACGKAPEAKPYLARIAQIKSSVKTTIITKRLQLSMENEEKGTHKELVMCQSGPGGIALVTGVAGPTPTAQGGKPGESKPGEKPAAGPSKISTELDAGLALDLIDVVNANPKDPGAPTALNNACVIYEKLFQFGQATKCYERLYKDYPDSEWGKEALWNSSRNHYRFFEFDQAVKGYLTVAQDPKFAGFGAPQGGARPDRLAARQRPAVRARRRHVQEVLGDAGRQAAGQRPGLLLRLQRLREGQGRQPPGRLPEGLHQEVRPAAGGRRVRRPGLHEAGRRRRGELEEQGRRPGRLQAGARRVHQPEAAARHAGGGIRRQGRLHDHGGEVQGLPEEGPEVRQQARPDQEDVRVVHRRGQAAQRGLPEDLELQGRHLDAGLVPADRRRLLRVRAEADQGGRQPARRLEEAGAAGLQAQSGRLRRGRGAVQGRHLPVRHPHRGRGQEALEGHAGPRRRSSASPTTTSRRRARTSRSTSPTSSRSSRTSESDWSTHKDGTPSSSKALSLRHGLAGGEPGGTRPGARAPGAAAGGDPDGGDRSRPSSCSRAAATPKRWPRPRPRSPRTSATRRPCSSWPSRSTSSTSSSG